jgi:hypothetical protein
MNVTGTPSIIALVQSDWLLQQATSIPTPLPPTITPLPVSLVFRGLSPEVIIGIVCAIVGVTVPIGIILIKYGVKHHKSKL